MSYKMLTDAIRFSSHKQLSAVFDNVKVFVFLPHDDLRANCLNIIEIRCDIVHRGKSYGFASDFPVQITDARFYEGYLREQFPRRVAREIVDYVMKEAL